MIGTCVWTWVPWRSEDNLWSQLPLSILHGLHRSNSGYTKRHLYSLNHLISALNIIQRTEKEEIIPTHLMWQCNFISMLDRQDKKEILQLNFNHVHKYILALDWWDISPGKGTCHWAWQPKFDPKRWLLEVFLWYPQVRGGMGVFMHLFKACYDIVLKYVHRTYAAVIFRLLW